MIKQEFLELMEACHYDIGGILKEILKNPTYCEFFKDSRINIKSSNFRAIGEKGRSLKVIEFIEKNEDTLNICGPIHFIEYLINHPSDNVLKLVINAQVPAPLEKTPMEVFRELFVKFKDNFFNESGLPCVTNLTASMLSDVTYVPIQGRDNEIREILCQFGKIMKNNVILTGSGGVGKTAIVEEFAMRELKNYVVYELNAIELISHGKQNSAAMLTNIIDTLSSMSGNKVLFIDEFHVLVKEGIADIIKRMFSRNTGIKILAATTSDEFKKYIEPDKALERRFHPLPILEIEGDVLKQVLTDWCNKLELHSGIKYDPVIIDFTIQKMRVERQKTSPDKEKDILDSSFARCKIDGIDIVDKSVVAESLSSRLSIPKEQLLSTMLDKVATLEDALKSKIKGQDFAIKNVAKVIQSSQMLKKSNKPMAVMFFAGETSVGKTELARQLTMHLFGSDKNLIQINCTDYKESHTVSSLLGSPPGYVGSEEGGSLVNKLRQRPFSVILFDEFEKAHKDIHDIMLPMFEEGIVTDRSGRVADITNCIIILTSNLGADKPTESSKSRAIGFGGVYSSEESYETAQDNMTERYKRYLSSLKKNIKPELISRITEIIIFSKLSDEVLKEIVESKLKDIFLEYSKQYSFDIDYSEDVVDFILKKSGRNPRKIANTIDKHVNSVITKAYTTKNIEDGSRFTVILVDKIVSLNIHP